MDGATPLTQVPDGPPPESEDEKRLPPLPVWPWEAYEQESAKETFRWLEQRSPRVVLHGDQHGRGINNSRQETTGGVPDMIYGKAGFIPDRDKFAQMEAFSGDG